MLLLAYLLTRSPAFEEAKIRLFATAEGSETFAQATARLAAMLDEVRIEAAPEIVADPGPQTVIEQSKGSSVVFQPFRLERGQLRNAFGGGLDEVVLELGATALVRASQEIVLDSEPEGGRHAEIAAAVDIADKTEKLAGEAEAAAEAAAAAAEAARQTLASATAAGAGAGTTAGLELELERARREAEQARRRAARTRAKADAAARRAAELRDQLPG